MIKNNKGYTLVELIVSAAILAVLSLGIAAFISFGMRLYNDISCSIRLQNDSQIAMNQMREYVVDCSSGIAWVPIGGTGDGVLYVVNQDAVNPTRRIVHIFRYVNSGDPSHLNTIFYGVESVFVPADPAAPAPVLNPATIASDKMAENVSNLVFAVKGTPTGADCVEMSLAMTRNAKEYQATQTIALRNKPEYDTSWNDLWAKIR